MIEETKFKKCCICKETKPFDAFGNRKRSKDGKREECKACRNSKKKPEYDYTKNLEKDSTKSKLCTKCGIEKFLTDFHKDKYSLRDGRHTICSTCKKEPRKAYYETNKKRELVNMRIWQAVNSDKVKIYRKLYYASNSDKAKRTLKAWRLANPEKVALQKKRAYLANPTKEIARVTRWVQENKEKRNTYYTERRKYDLNYRLRGNLRSRLGSAIRGNFKSGSAVDDLGCSIDFLKEYFIPKFYNNSETGEEMTWENYGEWHLDHIKPLSSFNLEAREEFLKACHYTNLQPLWAKDNLEKSDKEFLEFSLSSIL